MAQVVKGNRVNGHVNDSHKEAEQGSRISTHTAARAPTPRGLKENECAKL